MFAERLQPLVQRDRNFLRNFWRKLTQLRQALDGFGANLLGQAQQQCRSLTGVQVGQNEGNGLRMLDFEKFSQLLRVGFLQAFQLDGILLHRSLHLFEQPLSSGLSEGFYQYLLRIFRSTFGKVTSGKGKLVVLFEH